MLTKSGFTMNQQPASRWVSVWRDDNVTPSYFEENAKQCSTKVSTRDQPAWKLDELKEKNYTMTAIFSVLTFSHYAWKTDSLILSNPCHFTFPSWYAVERQELYHFYCSWCSLSLSIPKKWPSSHLSNPFLCTFPSWYSLLLHHTLNNSPFFPLIPCQVWILECIVIHWGHPDPCCPK